MPRHGASVYTKKECMETHGSRLLRYRRQQWDLSSFVWSKKLVHQVSCLVGSYPNSGSRAPNQTPVWRLRSWCLCESCGADFNGLAPPPRPTSPTSACLPCQCNRCTIWDYCIGTVERYIARDSTVDVTLGWAEAGWVGGGSLAVLPLQRRLAGGTTDIMSDHSHPHYHRLLSGYSLIFRQRRKESSGSRDPAPLHTIRCHRWIRRVRISCGCVFQRPVGSTALYSCPRAWCSERRQ